LNPNLPDIGYLISEKGTALTVYFTIQSHVAAAWMVSDLLFRVFEDLIFDSWRHLPGVAIVE
jgi:hypothetical protein